MDFIGFAVTINVTIEHHRYLKADSFRLFFCVTLSIQVVHFK